MSDEPAPGPSIEDNIITRLLGLLNNIKWFGFLRAQQFSGINRDGGPKSSIDFAKLLRMERAIVLAKALIEVFSGRLTFAPPPAWTTVRPAVPPGAGAGAGASPSSARKSRGGDAHPIACSPRAIREIFSTRSIREIVTHICIDLEITPYSNDWPIELLTYYQTPAEWSAAHYTPDQPPEPGVPPPPLCEPLLEAPFTSPPDSLQLLPPPLPDPSWQAPPPELQSSA